jgi:hypothetical protein
MPVRRRRLVTNSLSRKEVPMQYKTIVLQLLEQQPELYEPLRKKRNVLPTLELYAGVLKKKHEAWKAVLSPARPGSDPQQMASEALEIALVDLKNCLASQSPLDESEPLSLDEAMEFLRRRTPSA